MRRRDFLTIPAAAAAASAQTAATRFQIACMTLPWSAIPFERALGGIHSAGYRYVGLGLNHPDSSGTSKPILPLEAPPAEATRIGGRCGDAGLKPVMMFSNVNFEAADAAAAYRKRIDQANSAKIPFLIVFGRTSGGETSPSFAT